MRRITLFWVAAMIPWGQVPGSLRINWRDGQIIRAALQKDCKNVQTKDILELEVAKTASFQQKGLGGRKKPLKTNQGMIFIFDPPRMGQIWMKDTWIPLQLVHFLKSGAIVSIQEMPVEANPMNPQKIYSAQPVVDGVIELAPGRVAAPGYDLSLCVAGQ
jgi:uncharacterized membrane protein (UPF0127 family)